MRQRPPPRRRFRPVLMLFLLAVVAAIMYQMRCGDGFGLGPGGGSGAGDSESEGTRDRSSDRVDRGDSPDVRPALGEGGAPRRCRLRLDATGLRLNDEPSSVEKAVEACKRAGGAELTPTGDAVYGDLQQIREALDRAGVEVFVREPSPGR